MRPPQTCVIHVAKEAVRLAQPGELVSILEGGGKAVRQYVLMPDGTVAEQPIAVPAKPLAVVTKPILNEPGTAADGGLKAG